MKNFFFKASIFLGTNLFLALIVIAIPELRFNWGNSNTDSNLRITPQNNPYSFLILGTSRARSLSRGSGHAVLERELAGKVINIARGGGGGIVPAILYYDWFLQQGNTAQNVIYAVDPFILYSDLWNEERFFAEDEPFEPRFLYSMIRHEIRPPVIWNYIQSKFTLTWILNQPDSIDKKDRHLAFIDTAAVQKRLNSLYPQGQPHQHFDKYAPKLDSLVGKMATSSQVWLILLPTLLGPEPGHSRTLALCRTIEARYPNVHVADFVDSMRDPHFFYNHDHMNNAGINEFVGQHLKPLVAQGATP